MKHQLRFYSIILAAVIGSSVTADAQIATGGSFTLDQSVIAGGGGSDSMGGNFKVEGTIGQAAAGTRSTVIPFRVHNGFWTAQPLAPTAAHVTVGGRVMTAEGRAIRNAIVILTNAAGQIRTARTVSFGYYRFDDVEVGQTYILEVTSKHYQFAPQVHTVNEELLDLNFVAGPGDVQY